MFFIGRNLGEAGDGRDGLMGCRITQRAGWVKVWMSFIALTLWLAASGVHAQVKDRSMAAGPAPARLVCQVSGTGSRPGKVKEAQGLWSQKAQQAQAVEDETGLDGHSGMDLSLTRPVSVPAPGRPEGAGSYRCPEPSFQQGWAVSGSWPRPPPER
jgi:hypothetical protein